MGHAKLLILVVFFASSWAGAQTNPPLNGASTTAEISNYKITEAGLTLSRVSMVLYGTSKHWKEIAEWNQIPAPYKVALGKKLILKIPVQFNEKQINANILALWRSHFERRSENRAIAAVEQGPAGTEKAIGLHERPMPESESSGFSVRAAAAQAAGNLDQAIRYYRESRRSDPSNVTAWQQELSLLKKLNLREKHRQVAFEFAQLKVR